MIHSESTIVSQKGFQIVIFYRSGDTSFQPTIDYVKEFNEIYPGLVKLTFIDYGIAENAMLFTRLYGRLTQPLVVMYRDGVHMDEATQIKSRLKMDQFVSQFLYREMREILQTQ